MEVGQRTTNYQKRYGGNGYVHSNVTKNYLANTRPKQPHKGGKNMEKTLDIIDILFLKGKVHLEKESLSALRKDEKAFTPKEHAMLNYFIKKEIAKKESMQGINLSKIN